MQQDRLIGAAGEGRYARDPRLGRPAGVRQQPARQGAAGRDGRGAARPRAGPLGAPGAGRAARRRDGAGRGHPPPPHRRRRRPSATRRRRRSSTGSTTAPAADATHRDGRLQRRPAASRRTPGWSRPGSVPPYAEANGAEPAVTWPSGLQAPAMDTDGDPDCLDYIWVRGAVRVVDARLAFDRPDPRTRRSTRATTSGSARTWRSASRGRDDRCRARTLRLAHRGDWRHAPENSLAALPGGARRPGLRRPRVRRPPLVRRRARSCSTTRRSSASRAGRTGSTR